MYPSSNHRQGELIKNFNHFFSTDPKFTSRLNNGGICFALSLALIQEHILQKYDSSHLSFFKEFLEMGSEPQGIVNFYKHFHEHVAFYQDMIDVEARVEYRKSVLQKDYDILAVLEFALLVYAPRSNAIFLQKIRPQVSMPVFSDLNMRSLRSMSICLTPDIYDNFFSFTDKLSPFKAPGQYLLTFSDHAIAICVKSDGSFEYYDPNLESMLLDASAVLANKKLFFKWYKEKSHSGISITLHALDSNRSAHFSHESLVATEAAVDSATKYYLETHFENNGDIIAANLKSEALRTIYFADASIAKPYQDRVLAEFSLRKSQGIYMTGEFEEEYPNMPGVNFALDLILIAHRSGNLAPLREFLAAFGEDFLSASAPLFTAVYLNNLALFNLLWEYSGPNRTIDESLMTEAAALVKKNETQVADRIFQIIFEEQGKLKDQGNSIIFYLIRNNCASLLPWALKYEAVDLMTPWEQTFLLEYVAKYDTDEDAVFDFLSKQPIVWEFAHIEVLWAHNRVKWANDILLNKNLIPLLTAGQLELVLEQAILSRNIDVIEALKATPAFTPSWTKDIISDLINQIRTGKTEMLQYLFATNLIHPLLSRPEALPDPSWRTLSDWIQALRSLSQIEQADGDQKVLTSIIKNGKKDNNFSVVWGLLSLPKVSFKAQEVIFDGKPLFWHVLKEEDWGLVSHLLPALPSLDMYSRLHIIQNPRVIFEQKNLSNVTILSLCRKMDLSMEELFIHDGRIAFCLKTHRKDIFTDVVRQMDVKKKQQNLLYLQGAFLETKRVLASKMSTETQIRRALRKTNLILEAMDLLLDSSIDSYTADKAMIEQWRKHLCRDLSHLVQEWSHQRKGHNVKKMLAWTPAPVIIEHEDATPKTKKPYYSRLFQWVSGW